MAAAKNPNTSATEATFFEVLGENAPYIALLYLLNLVLLAAFVDYSALARGELTYEPLVGGVGTATLFTEVVVAGMAGLFAIVTLLGVLFAVDLAYDRQQEDLDEYDYRERISTISIVPALQLLTIILTPVLTGYSIVDGLQLVVSGLLALATLL